MFCSVLSAAIDGIDAVPITVEADVSDGMPFFAMVGYISSQVREARDRVRTALRHYNCALPPKRITLNLAPGDLRKDGTRYDLPIAAAILLAMGKIPPHSLDGAMVIGELHLDGRTEAVAGILPSVLRAREIGCMFCLLPAGNLEEGRSIRGIKTIGIRDLSDLLLYCREGPGALEKICAEAGETEENACKKYAPDFADLRGQPAVKRAAEIAAAGFHHLLLSGPPGSGKSMTAERISTILPGLTEEESLELSKIYSVVGLFPRGGSLMKLRPFRAPHHTVSAAALCGGGRIPVPGEITLAHRGVLFLDELPEMNPVVLEMLRQPMEEGVIRISRLEGTQIFPAAFLLVAAMNPCPCGYYPDRRRCTCRESAVRQYRARISQAIMDRIDLRCTVQAASYEALCRNEKDKLSSAVMRERVKKAADRQKERYQGTKILCNSMLGAGEIAQYCEMTDAGERLLHTAFEKLELSARSYHHVIKVARTIADLDGEDCIGEDQISEALFLRNHDDR